MTDETRCWVCRRTGAEVKAAMDRPMGKEVVIDGMLERVEDSRVRFEREARKWTGTQMDKVGDMDFAFVMVNPGQFKTVPILEDLKRSKKSFVDSLVQAAENARNGLAANLGIVEVPPTDKAQAERLTQMILEFEMRTGRNLGVELQPFTSGKGMPSGFDGLKLKDGIKYLTEIGLFYYSLQSEILRMQKGLAARNRPAYKISIVKLRGHPGGIPLCNVCQALVR